MKPPAAAAEKELKPSPRRPTPTESDMAPLLAQEVHNLDQVSPGVGGRRPLLCERDTSTPMDGHQFSRQHEPSIGGMYNHSVYHSLRDYSQLTRPAPPETPPPPPLGVHLRYEISKANRALLEAQGRREDQKRKEETKGAGKTGPNQSLLRTPSPLSTRSRSQSPIDKVLNLILAPFSSSRRTPMSPLPPSPPPTTSCASLQATSTSQSSDQPRSGSGSGSGSGSSGGKTNKTKRLFDLKRNFKGGNKNNKVKATRDNKGLGLFGASLEVANTLFPLNLPAMSDLFRGLPVPYMVARLVTYIDDYSHELRLLNLFRTSGNPAHIKELRDLFNQLSDAPLECSGVDAATSASLLKMFLRELPEPVIPIRLNGRFLELAQRFVHYLERLSEAAFQPYEAEVGAQVAGTPANSNRLLWFQPAMAGLRAHHERQAEEFSREIISLFRELPMENYQLLKYLSCFLHRVALEQRYNQMSTVALGIVFGPNIFRIKMGSLESIKQTQLTNQIISGVITNYSAIFGAKLTDTLGHPLDDLVARAASRQARVEALAALVHLQCLGPQFCSPQEEEQPDDEQQQQQPLPAAPTSEDKTTAGDAAAVDDEPKALKSGSRCSSMSSVSLSCLGSSPGGGGDSDDDGDELDGEDGEAAQEHDCPGHQGERAGATCHLSQVLSAATEAASNPEESLLARRKRCNQEEPPVTSKRATSFKLAPSVVKAIDELAIAHSSLDSLLVGISKRQQQVAVEQQQQQRRGSFSSGKRPTAATSQLEGDSRRRRRASFKFKQPRPSCSSLAPPGASDSPAPDDGSPAEPSKLESKLPQRPTVLWIYSCYSCQMNAMGVSDEEEEDDDDDNNNNNGEARQGDQPKDEETSSSDEEDEEEEDQEEREEPVGQFPLRSYHSDETLGRSADFGQEQLAWSRSIGVPHYMELAPLMEGHFGLDLVVGLPNRLIERLLRLHRAQKRLLRSGLQVSIPSEDTCTTTCTQSLSSSEEPTEGESGQEASPTSSSLVSDPPTLAADGNEDAPATQAGVRGDESEQCCTCYLLRHMRSLKRLVRQLQRLVNRDRLRMRLVPVEPVLRDQPPSEGGRGFWLACLADPNTAERLAARIRRHLWILGHGGSVRGALVWRQGLAERLEARIWQLKERHADLRRLRDHILRCHCGPGRAEDGEPLQHQEELECRLGDLCAAWLVFQMEGSLLDRRQPVGAKTLEELSEAQLAAEKLELQRHLLGFEGQFGSERSGPEFRWVGHLYERYSAIKRILRSREERSKEEEE